MAIGSLFKSETKELVERIRNRDFSSPEEKSELLKRLASSDSVKIPDAAFLLFAPDAQVREAAGRLLAARRDPETVRAVVGALKGRPETARRAALIQLAKLGLPDVPGKLSELTREENVDLRESATLALLDLPVTQETVPHLAQVVETGEAKHRLKAVERFAELATEKNIPFFERLLDDGDERIRMAAYRVILRFAGPERLPMLLARVPDEPYGTQQHLIGAIQQLVPQAGEEVVDQVLTLVSSGNTGLRTAALKILLARSDRVAVVKRFFSYCRKLSGWVRDRALESVHQFGPAVLEPAIELLSDEDAEVRGSALGLLSSFEDPRVAQAASRCLADPDWWVSISAADLLGRIGDASCVPALVQALEREEVRWAAVEALGRVGGPEAWQALARLVNDQRTEIRIEAIAALALAGDPRVIPVLQRVAENDPVKWVRTRACEEVAALARKTSVTVDEAALRTAAANSQVAEDSPPIHRLLALARREGASDVHVSVDSVPLIRVDGSLRRLEGQPLTAEASATLLMPLLTEVERARLEEEKQLDTCFHVANDGRYRGSLFTDRKGLNGVFRVIPERPPTITDVGLPNDIAEIAEVHQGIMLVTGPSGSGKSSTLASLVNLVNETRRSHVLTLEDPVEFVHPFKNSLVNQRQVGKHTESFAAALRAALREDPDVIVIGELRDSETVSLALTAAETGHLVLATLNATTAPKAVDRVIASFPPDEQPQVRESFAESLKIVVAQVLVPRADGKGRVGCFEILRGTRPIRSLIKDGKTYQIPSVMQVSQSSGMCSFDDSLMKLVRSGLVSPETAYMRATSKDAFEPLVSPKFLEELLA